MPDPLKILLVDDDVLLRKLIEDQFKASGEVKILSAESATEGLQRASETNPDFVLLDFKMKDQLTPEQLAENIKKFSKFSPVVIFTGFEQEIKKAASGAAGILKKDGNMRASSLLKSLHSIFFTSGNERLRAIDKKIEALKGIIYAPKEQQ